MRNNLEELIRILKQDVGFEDITTNALIQSDLNIKARIVSKQDGVLAGMELVSSLLNEFSIKVLSTKSDGDKLKIGDIILEMNGEARVILTLERTVLNLLMKMSGIATTTYNMVNKAREINPQVIVAGTRKTTPGLQFWEKNAIRLGGGDTHRYRLDDMVLIKDNHLALSGDITRAVKMTRNYVGFTKKIEIEVESLEDALTAADAGVDIIMLDNLEVKEIHQVLETFEKRNLREKVLIEVSGGINPNNIAQYAESGVDIISSGYITHSAGVLDMNLEVIE